MRDPLQGAPASGNDLQFQHQPGEVLGGGLPDWPGDLLSFAERRAYQRGVADARHAAKANPAAGAEPEYQMRAGPCTISGPREDVLHIGEILHATSERDAEDAKDAARWREVLKSGIPYSKDVTYTDERNKEHGA